MEKQTRDILQGWLTAIAAICAGVFIVALGVRCDRQPDHGGHGAERSPGWTKVRDAHLKVEPACAACGRTKDLQVHHVVPFHMEPARELDPENLITLCERCHLFVGHLTYYESWNVHVREDAKAWKKKIDHRPKKED